MRVPSAVGSGKVRVALSFEDWKEGNVAPAVFELAVPEKVEKDE